MSFSSPHKLYHYSLDRSASYSTCVARNIGTYILLTNIRCKVNTCSPAPVRQGCNNIFLSGGVATTTSWLGLLPTSRYRQVGVELFHWRPRHLDGLPPRRMNGSIHASNWQPVGRGLNCGRQAMWGLVANWRSRPTRYK